MGVVPESTPPMVMPIAIIRMLEPYVPRGGASAACRCTSCAAGDHTTDVICGHCQASGVPEPPVLWVVDWVSSSGPVVFAASYRSAVGVRYEEAKAWVAQERFWAAEATRPAVVSALLALYARLDGADAGRGALEAAEGLMAQSSRPSASPGSGRRRAALNALYVDGRFVVPAASCRQCGISPKVDGDEMLRRALAAHRSGKRRAAA